MPQEMSKYLLSEIQLNIAFDGNRFAKYKIEYGIFYKNNRKVAVWKKYYL